MIWDSVHAQKPTPKAEGTVSFESVLKELTDISQLPRYLSQTLCAQVSSWDTTGGNDDGFNGTYSYLKKNADSSLLIFDVKGPGVINRIWTPTPLDDTLDFYIDNLNKPAFSICYRDLFSGNVFPFVQPLSANQLGGFYCYLPIPFEKYCRIIYRGKKLEFSQIQYRLYRAETRVHSFRLPMSDTQKNALQQLAVQWNQPIQKVHDLYPDQPIQGVKQKFILRPGQSFVVFKTSQGGRILDMAFTPAIAFEGQSKQIDLRISWDDENISAVECPLADFFGYAFGKISMESLLIGVHQNRVYSFFPMPFDRSAKIELIYRKPDSLVAAPIAIESLIRFTHRKRDPEKEGKFYAYWNHGIREKAGQPHIFLKANGQGHYVGTLLQAQGLQAGMTYFFEGDDSTAVDGQPRMHGTGSEDYFNGGWYAMPDRWDGPMSLPLSGALEYALPFCRTGGYRFFLSDKISFEKNIFHSIEHGPTNNLSNTDYTSVGFYYSAGPAAQGMVPSNANTKIFQPDTLTFYPQLMKFGLEGKIGIRTAWSYPTGGETYSFTVPDDGGLKIFLSEAPPGDYKLYLDYVKNPEGCSFSIWQKQTELTDWMDGYLPEDERIEKQFVCPIHIDRHLNALTIRFKTKGIRDLFIFNRLMLVRK